MPFTPAHTVAVLPFRSWCPHHLIFSALVIGSVSPDFIYFLGLPSKGWWDHRFVSVLGFCLPTGLLAFWVFESFMRSPLMLLAPWFVRKRAAHFVKETVVFTPDVWARAALSILLGALTHVVWDAFTHGGRWGVAMFPALTESWLDLGNIPIAGYRLFQHGSTVVGLSILCIWFLRLPTQPDPGPDPILSPRFRDWTCATLVTLVMLAPIIALVHVPSATITGGGFRYWVIRSVVNGISLLIIGLLGFCLLNGRLFNKKPDP